MAKTKFLLVISAILLFAGIAVCQESVEQAVRVRLAEASPPLVNLGAVSVNDELITPFVQQINMRSASQVEALGSQYGFGRSASQVEALGSQYGFGR